MTIDDKKVHNGIERTKWGNKLETIQVKLELIE